MQKRHAAEDWLRKALRRAPRPLPAGRFPALLQEAQDAGFDRDDLADAVDLWLSYGYCRITDGLSGDIALLPAGESYIYTRF